MRNQADREGAARAAVATTPALAGGHAEAPAAEAAGDRAEAALADIAEILGGIATVHITSLEAAAAVADERGASADERLDLGRLGRRARDAVAKLPERERQLIELYYFAEKNLEEAGAALGLSKSWACRLHARAIALLREAMADTIE